MCSICLVVTFLGKNEVSWGKRSKSAGVMRFSRMVSVFFEWLKARPSPESSAVSPGLTIVKRASSASTAA